MRARLLVVAALLLTVAGVKASDLPLSAGHERWIVVLGRDASPSAVGELVRTLGGQVESDLTGRVVIAAPTAAIEKVLAHPGVKYVQPTGVGAPPADVIRVQPEALIDAPIQSDALTWTSGEYRYDGAGNIVSIGTAAAPGTQGYRTYSYDQVSRLTKAQISGTTPSGIYEYSYDDYGNRTGYAVNSQWVTVPVNATNNRLTDATYDVPGNRKTRGSTTATYDGFGMMKSYQFDGTNQETFVYTANDERIGVLRGTEWTWSLRDSGGRVLRQYRSSSTNTSAAWLWVEDFVYRDNLPLGGERVPEEGGRRHYHVDHLGSTRLVTGQFGSVISEHDFLPFGEERTAIPQHQAKGFDREEPHRFTGHERDFDTPTPNDSSAYIDYMHARYYATKTGRFLSVDPKSRRTALSVPQLYNRYSYALNNPLNNVDLDGEDVTPVRVLTRNRKHPTAAPRIAYVDSRLVPRLQKIMTAASAKGISFTFNNLLRTQAEQDALKTGNTKNNKGTSPHTAGLAIDINVCCMQGTNLAGMTAIARDADLSPLSNQEKDKPHFQANDLITRGDDGKVDDQFKDLVTENQQQVEDYEKMRKEDPDKFEKEVITIVPPK